MRMLESREVGRFGTFIVLTAFYVCCTLVGYASGEYALYELAQSFRYLFGPQREAMRSRLLIDYVPFASGTFACLIAVLAAQKAHLPRVRLALVVARAFLTTVMLVSLGLIALETCLVTTTAGSFGFRLKEPFTVVAVLSFVFLRMIPSPVSEREARFKVISWSLY